MNRYTITREIATPLFVPQPLTIGEITLGSGAVARGTGTVFAAGYSEAEDFRSAIRGFEHKLRIVLDALAVGELVGSSTYVGSLLVTKDGDPHAFFRWFRTDPDTWTLTPLTDEDNMSAVASATSALETDTGLATQPGTSASPCFTTPF